jgi:hypothetical protein
MYQKFIIPLENAEIRNDAALSYAVFSSGDIGIHSKQKNQLERRWEKTPLRLVLAVGNDFERRG